MKLKANNTGNAGTPALNAGHVNVEINIILAILCHKQLTGHEGILEETNGDILSCCSVGLVSAGCLCLHEHTTIDRHGEHALSGLPHRQQCRAITGPFH